MFDASSFASLATSESSEFSNKEIVDGQEELNKLLDQARDNRRIVITREMATSAFARGYISAEGGQIWFCRTCNRFSSSNHWCGHSADTRSRRKQRRADDERWEREASRDKRAARVREKRDGRQRRLKRRETRAFTDIC